MARPWGDVTVFFESVFIYLSIFIPCYNVPMDIESLVVSYGVVAIFLMMITNGFTMFPSSQFLYIIAGWLVSEGLLSLPLVIFFGAIGNTIGNTIMYELIREKGLKYILKYKVFRKQDVEKVHIAFEKHGLWFLFIGKLLPSIKVFVPIVAAIGKAKRAPFIFIMTVTSFIWTTPFLAIGYYLGKSSEIFERYIIVLFVVAALVIFGFYKYVSVQKIPGKNF